MAFNAVQQEVIFRDQTCPTHHGFSSGRPGSSVNLPFARIDAADFSDVKDLVTKVREKMRRLSYDRALVKQNFGLPEEEEITKVYACFVPNNVWSSRGYTSEFNVDESIAKVYLFLHCGERLTTDPILYPRSLAEGFSEDAQWVLALEDPKGHNSIGWTKYASAIVTDKKAQRSSKQFWFTNSRGQIFDITDNSAQTLNRRECASRRCAICRCRAYKTTLLDGTRVLIKDGEPENSTAHGSLQRNGVFRVRHEEYKCNCGLFNVICRTCKRFKLERDEELQIGQAYTDFSTFVVSGKQNGNKNFGLHGKGVYGSKWNKHNWTVRFPEFWKVRRDPGTLVNGLDWDMRLVYTMVIDLEQPAEYSYCMLPVAGLPCRRNGEDGQRARVCSSGQTEGDAYYGDTCRRWFKGIAKDTVQKDYVARMCSLNKWGMLQECDCEARAMRKAYRILRRDARTAEVPDKCWWLPCKNQNAGRWVVNNVSTSEETEVGVQSLAAKSKSLFSKAYCSVFKCAKASTGLQWSSRDLDDAEACPDVCVNVTNLQNLDDTTIGDIYQYTSCSAGANSVSPSQAKTLGVIESSPLQEDGQLSDYALVINDNVGAIAATEPPQTIAQALGVSVRAADSTSTSEDPSQMDVSVLRSAMIFDWSLFTVLVVSWMFFSTNRFSNRFLAKASLLIGLFVLVLAILATLAYNTFLKNGLYDVWSKNTPISEFGSMDDVVADTTDPYLKQQRLQVTGTKQAFAGNTFILSKILNGALDGTYFDCNSETAGNLCSVLKSGFDTSTGYRIGGAPIYVNLKTRTKYALIDGVWTFINGTESTLDITESKKPSMWRLGHFAPNSIQVRTVSTSGTLGCSSRDACNVTALNFADDFDGAHVTKDDPEINVV